MTQGETLHFTLPRPGDDRYKAKGYLKHIEVPVSGAIAGDGRG